MRITSSASEARTHTRLAGDAKVMLATGHDQLGLSGRGYDRVLKLARTVADLAGAERVGSDHVGIALGLRRRGGR